MRKNRIKSILIAFFIATAAMAPIAYFVGLAQNKVNADRAELDAAQNETALSNALSEAIKKNAHAEAKNGCIPDMGEAEARALGCLFPLSRSSIPEPTFKPLNVAEESLSNEIVSTLAHSGGLGVDGAPGNGNSDGSGLENPLSAALEPEGGILASGGFGQNGVSRFIAPGGVSAPVGISPPGSGPQGSGPGPVKSGPIGGNPTGGPTTPTPTPPVKDPLPPVATPDPETPPIVTPLPGAFFLFVSGVFGFFGIAWRPRRR